MNSKTIWSITFFGSIVVAVTGFYFGGDIPFDEQWQLYESLRTTSAIIFAVIGAWLTIIYPDELKKIFVVKKEAEERRPESIELLVSNIRYSTLILITILIVGVVGQILRHSSLQQYFSFFRSLSFSLLLVLTFLQIWTLLMTLAQAELAKEKITNEKSKQMRTSNFFSIAQKKSKPKKIDNKNTN